jgi:peroxiredoxin
MAVVTSAPVQPAMEMPAFRLRDFDGQVTDSGVLGPAAGILVVFMCNHCPYVKHIADGLSTLAGDLAEMGIATIGINSNDPARVPEDDAEHMRENARAHAYRFPYLIDAGQDVARAFGAVCTPDFFLFDGSRRLYYRGQMDGSRPGKPEPVTGCDLRAAASRLLASEQAPADQRASMGCTIKWRKEDAGGLRSSGLLHAEAEPAGHTVGGPPVCGLRPRLPSRDEAEDRVQRGRIPRHQAIQAQAPGAEVVTGKGRELLAESQSRAHPGLIDMSST